MGWVRLALRVSAAVCGLTLVTPALGAAMPASADTTSPQASAAAVALGRKAVILVQLGSFTRANSKGLPPTVQPLALTGASHQTLVDALKRADSTGAKSLAALRAARGGQVSTAVAQALARLSATDLARAGSGKSISVSGQTYMNALDSLLFADGGALHGAPADPQTLQSALAAAAQGASTSQPAGGAPPAGQPSPPAPDGATVPAADQPSASASHSSSLPLVFGGLLALAAAAAAAFFRSRRRPQPAPVVNPNLRFTPTIPSQPSPRAWTPSNDGVRGSLPPLTPPASTGAAGMARLLDISRRLASITAVDEIHRVIAREAMGLVDASAASVIVREGDQLVVAYEGRPGLLVPDSLAEGAIGQVAETGQPALQVSATEPALRQLPAAMLAVPLVAGGSVAAVLVLLRAAGSPFTADDRDLLMALTPVAAAAMHGAAQTTAAVRESLQDALTGVGNRLRFDRDLAALTASSTGAVSLVMIDLDHFKSVNDTYGHPAGDALLRALGEVLRGTVRPGDGVYRYGGEEFALLLPETSAAHAADLAERVRVAVESSTFDLGSGVHLTATASLGVAAVDSGDGAGLVKLADAALYDAKHGGRNRVCLSAAATAS